MTSFTIEQIEDAGQRLQLRLKREGVDVANLQGVHIDSVITDLLNELTDMPAYVSPVRYRIEGLRCRLEQRVKGCRR